MNIDGAVFSDRKQAGAGVLIRDGAGEVVAALSKKWKWPLGAIEAEAKALEAGVVFADDVGIRDAENLAQFAELIFNMDCIFCNIFIDNAFCCIWCREVDCISLGT